MNADKPTRRYLTVRVPIPSTRTVVTWTGAAIATGVTFATQGLGPALGVLVSTVAALPRR